MACDVPVGGDANVMGSAGAGGAARNEVDAARGDGDDAAKNDDSENDDNGMVQELRIRRSSVNRQFDMKRLQDEKEDLNDALLDFFVKLGQTVIPCGGLEGGFPSVAYLGSYFFDVLQKGGVKDGQAGHANVANWAKRRLGEGGLFFDGVGALAVPVNEMLVAGSLKEKHWWLALLLNPRGGSKPKNEESTSLVCLDSLARAEVRCDPPIRAYKYGNAAYPVDVFSIYRQSFSATIRFKASGNGSSGGLPDPRSSRLLIGGREFTNPYVDLTVNRPGGYGVPGLLEGTLDFSLESSVPTSGEYVLHFGDEVDAYLPVPKFRIRRDPSAYQMRVAKFLGGYTAREWAASGRGQLNSYENHRIEAAVRLPDVPQQETANDCGYFMLEQTLLALQLTPDGFRTLASVPADMLGTLPWPSQKDIDRRKLRLREALETLFIEADIQGTNDVDELIKSDVELRRKIQAAMWDGPRFTEAVKTLATVAAPRKEYTQEEFGALSTKQLRTICSQYGVLPSGMVERSDLLEALAPVAKKPKQAESSATADCAPSPTASPEADAGTKRSGEEQPREEEAKRQRIDAEHLGALRFTAADLETMPLKKLRDLCKQHRVLPACAIERADFVQALTPFIATASGAPNSTSATQQNTQGVVEPEPAQDQPATPVLEETKEERKARWTRLVGEHLAGVTFVIEDLEVMPIKVMRALCMQNKVLPESAVERADFVQALKPLAGKSTVEPTSRTAGRAAAKPANQQAPTVKPKETARRDFSKFLGSLKPNFTKIDLEEMPDSTLRTLCIKHGVLPAGTLERADLLKALGVIAVRSAATANALRVDDIMLDEDD